MRLLRLALVLAAALAGLFGILAMLGLVIWYLCTIDSDGVAYMAPFVDSERPALWRTLLRRPQPDNKFRPRNTAAKTGGGSDEAHYII